jgi:hypothetical protein
MPSPHVPVALGDCSSHGQVPAQHHCVQPFQPVWCESIFHFRQNLGLSICITITTRQSCSVTTSGPGYESSFGSVVMNIDLLSQECVGHSIAFSNAWTSSPASKPLKIGHGRGMCLCTSVIFHHRVHTTSERCQRIHIWSCFFGGGPKYSVFIQIVSYIETQFVVFICRLEDYARKTANVAFESCCLGRLQNGHPQSPREPRIETYQDSPECVLTLYI